MVFKIALFTFLASVGLLLLNNGLSFGFSSGLVQFFRVVGGISGLVAAVALALE